MRAQQMPPASALDVKRVHVIARGMVLGNVQSFEIVIGRLDLRTFNDAEANRKKNAFQLFVGLPDDVRGAEGPFHAWNREIDTIARRRSLFGCGFNLAILL